MSTPKIYTSQEFQQYQDGSECPRCNQQEEIYIQLTCGHKFCIVCITFAYLKFKGTLQNKNKIKCLQCQKLSELDEELHLLIREVISKELGPIVKNQGENNESRMSINQTNLQQSNKSQPHKTKYNLRSEDDSIVQNGALTPNKNSKAFYSKCESPQNSQFNSEDSCIIHPTEDISYICMSCGVKPLCYKCIKSNKHSSHDVKIAKKALEVLNQKFSLLHLETAEKIQNIELYQKRLYDRKLIFQDRIEKSIKEIRGVFVSLERKILEKSNQIIEEYQTFYHSKIEQMETKAQESTEILKDIKQFQEMVKDFINSNDHILSNKTSVIRPSKAVQKYEQIESKRKNLFDFNSGSNILLGQKSNTLFSINETILDPINYQNSELIRNITQITESIQSMSFSNFVIEDQSNERVKFNETIPYTSIMKSDILFNKNKTMALRNCSSRQKLQKHNNQFIIEQNYAKRIKTNFPASLNTSRDRREKKHTTKTEEDERRLKTKVNYKTEATTQLKNIEKAEKNQNSKELHVPAYITKHLEKHNMAANGSRKVSPFNNGTMYMMENLHTSKNTSKIVSKTVNVLHNDDFNNRKKNKEIFHLEGNKDKKQMIKSAKNPEGVKKKR